MALCSRSPATAARLGEAAKSTGVASAKSTVPASGTSSPLRHLSTVVLPDPLGPINATTSPRWMSRSMPFKTSTSPKRLCSPRTSKTRSSCDMAIQPPLERGLPRREHDADDPVDRGGLDVDDHELPAEGGNLLCLPEHLGDEDERGERGIFHEADEGVRQR